MGLHVLSCRGDSCPEAGIFTDVCIPILISSASNEHVITHHLVKDPDRCSHVKDPSRKFELYVQHMEFLCLIENPC